MNRFPTDFDQECADGLSSAELSELVIGYAQENERLEAENKRLRRIFQIYREMSKPALALQPMPDGSLTIKVVGRPLLGELDALMHGDLNGLD